VKNKLFVFIAAIVFLSCHPTRKVREASDDLMAGATGMTFDVYYSKHDISKRLYQSYRKLYENEMYMADKDKEFNSLDVREKGLPDRRFIFGAKSISNVYELFVYEEGGVGLKNYCIVLKREAGDVGSVQRVYIFRRPNDINDLKEIIAKRDYRISNSN